MALLFRSIVAYMAGVWSWGNDDTGVLFTVQTDCVTGTRICRWSSMLSTPIIPAPRNYRHGVESHAINDKTNEKGFPRAAPPNPSALLAVRRTS